MLTMIDIKPLKAKILELAIQGKLTEAWREKTPSVELSLASSPNVLGAHLKNCPQSTDLGEVSRSDERGLKNNSLASLSAEALLAKIQAEKAELIKQGKLKKEKPLPPIKEEEIPFDIPETWKWVRLGNIGYTSIGLIYKPTDIADEGTIVLRSSNIQNGKIDFNDIVKVKIDVPESKMCHKGDILICVRNGSKKLVGKSAIIESDGFTYGAFMAIFRSICNNYILQIFNSAYFRNTLSGDVDTTTITQITQDVLKNLLIPLPPLAEQQKIVEKLEECFDYLNNIEKAYSSLTTNALSLKSKILELAIQGKLVEQRPEEGTAEELYNQIQTEKAELIKQDKLKKDKRLDNIEIDLENIEFEIPNNWKWTYLGSILNKLTDGTHKTPKYTTSGVKFISVKDMSNGVLSLDNTKFISKEEHDVLYTRCNPEKGDMLLSKVGTTGVPAIIETDEEFSLFVSVALLKYSHNCIYNKFLYYLLYSPLVQKQAEENTRGVGNKNWVLDAIAKTLVPLPPLAEQHRIVAKIEELFTLVDSLTTK